MIQHSPRTGLLPRIPDRLTCRNALLLGLHGKMTQQVSKSINALQVSHRESFFFSFRTYAGKVELASTIKVTVGLNRRKKTAVTETIMLLSLRHWSLSLFLSSLQRSSETAHTGKTGLQQRFVVLVVILTGVCVPSYRLFSRFSSSQHPVEASGADWSDATPSTEHLLPSSTQTWGRERALVRAYSSVVRSFQPFLKANSQYLKVWMYFSHWYIPALALLISPPIYPKLKN